MTISPDPDCPGTKPYTGTYEGRATSVTFTGLAPDGRYRIHVAVLDAEGNVLADLWDAMETPPTMKVTIDPIAGTLVAGSPVTVTGKVSEWVCLAGGFVPRMRWVELHGRSPGGDWKVLGREQGRGWWDTETETRDVIGRVWFEQHPNADTEYRLFYEGQHGRESTYSETTSVAVDATGQLTTQPTSLAYLNLPGRSATQKAQVRPRVTATSSSPRVRLGRRVTITGSVRPRHPGERVVLQRHNGEKWVDIRGKRLDADSRYRVRWEPPTRGMKKLRVFRPTDWNHAAGRSPTLRLDVQRP